MKDSSDIMVAKAMIDIAAVLFIYGVLMLALNWPGGFRRFVRSVCSWFAYRRQCSWCHRLTGGNPLARRTTHGICPSCEKKFLEEI